MSQNDMSLADQAGASFRSDVNSALQALASLSSGAAAPSTTYAYQYWLDTTTGQLKQRNAANSGWIVRATAAEAFTLSRSSNTILAEADRQKVLIATGSFTQTLTAAATLGDGWFVDVVVDSGVTLVIDPNGAETIDGSATKSIVGPTQGRIVCTGALFRSVGFVSSGFATVTLGTAVASTSGASIDFTGLPSGVKKIDISFVGMSTNGTSAGIVQIGDSGGFETSGYLSACGLIVGASAFTATNGFAISSPAAASVVHGIISLVLVDAATNTWSCSSNLGYSNTAQVNSAGGSKSLSATLDRVRLTTAGGTDTFDAGTINIQYWS